MSVPVDTSIIPSTIEHTASKTWTILVYLHADHDYGLHGGEEVFELLKQVGYSKDFKIVLQWDKLYGDAKRGLIDSNGFVNEVNAPENFDDPETLVDFIKWGVSHSADYFGLILWDHGGNWLNGFGGDKNPGGNSSMKVRALTTAIKSAIKSNFRFIGMDACLMGSLEMCIEFKGLTDLYIANAEMYYGYGWDYKETLCYLKNNPDIPMNDFAIQESEFWLEYQKRIKQTNYFYAHAAYDLTKLDILLASINCFVPQLINQFDLLKEIRTQVITYSNIKETGKIYSFSSYIDILHFFSLLRKKLQNNSLLNAIIDGINLLVVQKSKKSKISLEISGCLSIWMPTINQKNSLDEYLINYQNYFDWCIFIKEWFKFTNLNPVDLFEGIIEDSQISRVNGAIILKFRPFSFAKIARFYCAIIDQNLNYIIQTQILKESNNDFGIIWDKKVFVLNGYKTTFFYEIDGEENFSSKVTFLHQEVNGSVKIKKDDNNGYFVDKVLNDEEMTPKEISIGMEEKILPIYYTFFENTDNIIEHKNQNPTIIGNFYSVKSRAGNTSQIMRLIIVDWSGRSFSKEIEIPMNEG